MPSWWFPAVLTGGISLLTGTLAVIWVEIKTTKRELREDLKASETRQREEIRELRSDVKALADKADIAWWKACCRSGSPKESPHTCHATGQRCVCRDRSPQTVSLPQT